MFDLYLLNIPRIAQGIGYERYVGQKSQNCLGIVWEGGAQCASRNVPRFTASEDFYGGRISDPRDRTFVAQQATKALMVRKVEERSDILVAAEKFLWPERGTDTTLSAAEP
jgi:hypothetical protein